MTTTATLTTPSRLSARFASCGSDKAPMLVDRMRAVTSRAEAVRLGLQVDVSNYARRAGYSVPVFVSDVVHRLCHSVEDAVEDDDTPAYRLWRILWTLRMQTAWCGFKEGRLEFRVPFLKDADSIAMIPFVAIGSDYDCHDDRPTLTIMLPFEEQD